MTGQTPSFNLPDFGGQQACLQVDPELFFPDQPGQEQFRAKELQSLCTQCPVVTQCLEYALANTVSGVWAATTTAQRRKLRKRAGSTNPQQQRAARDRATVQDLARKGLTSRQIIDQTGLHEQTVWRALRAMPTSQSATTSRVA